MALFDANRGIVKATFCAKTGISYTIGDDYNGSWITIETVFPLIAANRLQPLIWNKGDQLPKSYIVAGILELLHDSNLVIDKTHAGLVPRCNVIKIHNDLKKLAGYELLDLHHRIDSFLSKAKLTTVPLAKLNFETIAKAGNIKNVLYYLASNGNNKSNLSLEERESLDLNEDFLRRKEEARKAWKELNLSFTGEKRTKKKRLSTKIITAPQAIRMTIKVVKRINKELELISSNSLSHIEALLPCYLDISQDKRDRMIELLKLFLPSFEVSRKTMSEREEKAINKILGLLEADAPIPIELDVFEIGQDLEPLSTKRSNKQEIKTRGVKKSKKKLKSSTGIDLNVKIDDTLAWE